MQFELRKVANNTYYFNDTNRVMLYKTANSSVVLFDSGKNHKAGVKILDVIRENGWTLQAIYLTHSHADHMGGAAFLNAETGCPVYCPENERFLTVPTIFEPGFMYGGFPPNEMRLPFLCAQPCETLLLTEDKLPKGITMFPLPGHTFNMYGFKTEDEVYFLADAYVGDEIISHHPISFLYDVEKYLETLDMLENLEGEYYIAAHAYSSNNIHPVLSKNRDSVLAVIDTILNILKEEDCNFDQLLAKLFTHFDLVMNFIQHYLVGCTIKSYLMYLRNQRKIKTKVVDNQLLWYAV
jgi:glyoxylase-like metal-dependent hydrolase (beta-lactamase superfamily II)